MGDRFSINRDRNRESRRSFARTRREMRSTSADRPRSRRAREREREAAAGRGRGGGRKGEGSLYRNVPLAAGHPLTRIRVFNSASAAKRTRAGGRDARGERARECEGDIVGCRRRRDQLAAEATTAFHGFVIHGDCESGSARRAGLFGNAGDDSLRSENFIGPGRVATSSIETRRDFGRERWNELFSTRNGGEGERGIARARARREL